MTLQILVPQYLEGEEIIKPLLDSIAMQQNVDFNEIGVIIVNDGTAESNPQIKLSDELLNKYPYEIEYILMPHGGISKARNNCLDRATADYVMFCDSDDLFYNLCGLFIIFREIQFGFDVFVSEFVQETRTVDNEIAYISMEHDVIFVHGKVYRRKYLTDNNIRFNDKLLLHEDGYFNALCTRLTQNIHYCPHPFYLWKFRADSTCRKDQLWALKTYDKFIDSEDELVQQFLDRGNKKLAMAYSTAGIFSAYYTMAKRSWLNQENKVYKDATEQRAKQFYQKYEYLWAEMPTREKMTISNTIRGQVIKDGMDMETITLEEWIEHIKSL